MARKLGIFGYDRITKPEDITDGASNTILMIQVPPPYQGPWIAGGGSTMRTGSAPGAPTGAGTTTAAIAAPQASSR